MQKKKNPPNKPQTQTGTGDRGSKFEHYALYDGFWEHCYDPKKILIINRFKSSLLKRQLEGLEILGEEEKTEEGENK